MAETFRERIAKLSAEQLRLLTLKLQQRLEQVTDTRQDPVAIIGFGCRFPGGVNSPETYWELLKNGVDAISEVPKDRWDADAWYDPDPDAPGKISTKWAGFLDDVAGFDAPFFEISPREAVSMDPQQRITLEVAQEAIERAGYAPSSLVGKNVGVFLGISGYDYANKMNRQDQRKMDAYMASGSSHSIASGRISYIFGFRGPSVSIDTACSSSSVAIHQAMQSVRTGESEMALAGGVNLLLSPETTMALSRSHMMAPDGRCKTFDAAADGYVRGEGAGLVVLKKLSAAKRDGDKIWAVIRGSAVNQDGKSNGLTAPNGPSQVDVIKAALKNAGLKPSDVGYIETHGTGTELGDPIEVQALGTALGRGRDKADPLKIGAVKTNFGHLESAAGVAGLLKVVMALQHKTIPPHLHLKTLNPHIAWDQYPVTIPTKLTEWKPSNNKRVGGVSSFGFSGTNVHILVEEAPETTSKPVVSDTEQLLLVSGQTEAALNDALENLADWIVDHPELDLADICYTLANSRDQARYRIALPAKSKEAAIKLLRSTDREDQITGRAGHNLPEVAFLFTGQGAQSPGMGKDLYTNASKVAPAFKKAIDECDELLKSSLGGVSIRDLMFDENDSRIHQTEWTQPALFTYEYAMAKQWQSWGVAPEVVLGHSVGEFVAATIAGVFSLADGLKLIAQRGKLMANLSGNGTMASVLADQATVLKALDGFADKVSIAAVNGPTSTVISGYADAVNAVSDKLSAQGLQVKPLKVSHGFHSPQMDAMLDEFEKVASAVTFSAPEIKLISNVTGKEIGSEIQQPKYWRNHVRQAVRFNDAMQETADLDIEIYLEMGPHPVLTSMGQNCLPESKATWLSSGKRTKDINKGTWHNLLVSAGGIFATGGSFDWKAFYAGQNNGKANHKVELPTYPFQRQNFWVEEDENTVAQLDAVHPLLGQKVVVAGLDKTVYQNIVGAELFPFLKDHQLFGLTVWPSPAFMEMAFAAAGIFYADTTVRKKDFVLKDFVLQEALVLPEKETRIVQTLVSAGGNNECRIEIYSQNQKGEWRLHVACAVVKNEKVNPAKVAISDLKLRCPSKMTSEEMYAALARRGLAFGDKFRGASEIYYREGEVLGKVTPPAGLFTVSEEGRLHPAVLDACLHLMIAALPVEMQEDETAWLLMAFDSFTLHQEIEGAFWVETKLDLQAEIGAEVWRASLILRNDEGELLAEVSDIQLKKALPAQLKRLVAGSTSDLLYHIDWQENPPAVNWPDLTEIAKTAQPDLQKISDDFGLGQYSQFLPEMDKMCGLFVVQAFNRLGWQQELGQIVTSDALLGELGILKRHARLVYRLLGILAEDGYLNQVENGWKVVQLLDPDPKPDWRAILAAWPSFDAELKLTGRCGDSLVEALTGKVDAVDLLFPDGSMAETERMYEKAPVARAFNSLVKEAVKTALAGRPNAPLKVLEIGAGTGGTTSSVVPLLNPKQTDYYFTDISPTFGQRAAEKFAAYPFIRYGVLDVSRNPENQVAPGEKFDMIVAANVLHATPDLQTTLKNVRSLLNEGGILVLLEGHTQQRFGDLTMGLTEGWWSFTDTDVRPDYVLAPFPVWQKILTDADFETIVSVPGQDNLAGVLGQQSVIIAQAPKADANDADWLIVGSGEEAKQVENSLQKNQVKVNRINEAEIEKRFATTLPANVVYVPETPVALSSKFDAETVQDGQLDQLMPALEIVQILEGKNNPPRLWFVTAGAQKVNQTGENAELNPQSAALWGMANTIVLEQPALNCTRVDLSHFDANQTNKLAEFLVESPENADQWALRDDKWHVRRLVDGFSDAETPKSAPIVDPNESGSWLISGGLSGIGLLVAEWLAEKGVKHLVLMSRSGATRPEAKITLEKLNSAGVTVTVSKGDVANTQDVKNAVAEAVKLAPLHGVVHSAGLLDDGMLAQQSRDRFKTVMNPKVKGAWLLHTETRAANPKHFILFSSGVGLLGAMGQANHAATNAFLDAFAGWRRQQNLPAITINWGAWAEIGSVVKKDVGDRLAQKGTALIDPKEGIKILAEIVEENVLQTGVFAVEWETYLSQYIDQTVPAFLKVMAAKMLDSASQNKEKTVMAESGLKQQISDAPAHRRQKMIDDWVETLVLRVLDLDDTNMIDRHQPLQELGMDSLMAVELRNKLSKALDQTLSATLLFDYPTVQDLIGLVTENLIQDETESESNTASEAATETESIAPATSNDDLDELSDDEMAALLAQKLDFLDQNKK